MLETKYRISVEQRIDQVKALMIELPSTDTYHIWKAKAILAKNKEQHPLDILFETPVCK
jgi:hypothetical protein